MAGGSARGLGVAPAGPRVPDEAFADEERDESPLAEGPPGHDVDGAERWLPPDAYSAAVWEADCVAEAVS